jgi:hypothetical protein
LRALGVCRKLETAEMSIEKPTEACAFRTRRLPRSRGAPVDIRSYSNAEEQDSLSPDRRTG